MIYKRTFFYTLLFISLSLWIYLNYHWQASDNFKFHDRYSYEIIGVVDSLPQYQNHHLSFILKLKKINSVAVKANIKLNWYGKSPYLHIGETWRLYVKLKHPKSIPIIDNFDYGHWLILHNLQAVGYVIADQNNLRLKPFNGWNIRYHIDQWRSDIDEKIYRNLKNTRYVEEAALISGLTVGIRTDMTKQQWADFQNTGTVHLMAIAGLHIGFFAGFIFLACNWLWSRSVNLVLFYPAQKAAVIAALLAAFIYSLMAGFALPTQRAFIMVTVMTLANFSNRNVSLINSLSLAFVLILLWNPLAIMSASFWLSFSAVGLIFYGIHGRINPNSTMWWRWGRIQWVLTVGLTPFTLWFFQQSSLSGLVANLFAIPVVGFIIIPLCLTMCIFLEIYQRLAHSLLLVAAFILFYLMKFLNILAFMPYSVWHFSFTNVIQFFAMVFAFLLLLAPKGFPVRWVGVLLLIYILIC